MRVIRQMDFEDYLRYREGKLKFLTVPQAEQLADVIKQRLENGFSLHRHDIIKEMEQTLPKSLYLRVFSDGEHNCIACHDDKGREYFKRTILADVLFSISKRVNYDYFDGDLNDKEYLNAIIHAALSEFTSSPFTGNFIIHGVQDERNFKKVHGASANPASFKLDDSRIDKISAKILDEQDLLLNEFSFHKRDDGIKIENNWLKLVNILLDTDYEINEDYKKLDPDSPEYRKAAAEQAEAREIISDACKVLDFVKGQFDTYYIPRHLPEYKPTIGGEIEQREIDGQIEYVVPITSPKEYASLHIGLNLDQDLYIQDRLKQLEKTMAKNSEELTAQMQKQTQESMDKIYRKYDLFKDDQQTSTDPTPTSQTQNERNMQR